MQEEELAQPSNEQPISGQELMDKINERDQAIESLAVRDNSQ